MAELNGTEWADGNITCPSGGANISHIYTCPHCGQVAPGGEAHYCYGSAYSYWGVPLADSRDIVRLLEEIRDLLKKDE